MNPDTLNILFLAGSFVMAVLLGMIIIPNILLISYKKQLFDIPDGRKVHKTPVPRLGGLSFFPVILIGMALNIGLRYLLGPSLDELTPYRNRTPFHPCRPDDAISRRRGGRSGRRGL